MTTPGIPGLRLPDKAPRVEQETTPPSTVVRISGKGWSANIPMVVVTALLSAVGARMLPTNTTTDQSLERAQVMAERKALEDERFRQEVRQELAAIRTQLDRRSDEISNRVAVVEARLAGK